MNNSPAPETIRDARHRAGLTQAQAAQLISSRPRTWQDWERGVAKMRPALWELFKIKSALF